MFIKYFLLSTIFLFSGAGFALDLDEASHLLRRTEFGPTMEKLDSVVNKMTRAEAVRSLFAKKLKKTNSDFQTFIELTLKYEKDVQDLVEQLNHEQNPLSSINFKDQHKQLTKDYFNSVINNVSLSISGSELTSEKNKIFNEISNYKIKTAFETASKALITVGQLQYWWIKEMIESKEPFREMMTLFWYSYFHSNFTNGSDVPLMALQHHIIRTNALGSFKTMFNDMHKDFALLFPKLKAEHTHVTGKINLVKGESAEEFSKSSLNKELARKLLYVTLETYSATNRRKVEKALTGYEPLFGDAESRIIIFNPENHNSKKRTFLTKTASLKKQDIISALLESKDSSKNMVRKLWRYFISSNPDEALVKQWEKILRRSDYDIKKIMTVLLKSSAFYNAKGERFSKSYVDLVVGLARSFDLKVSNVYKEKENLNKLIISNNVDLTHYFAPPEEILSYNTDVLEAKGLVKTLLSTDNNLSQWSSWLKTYNTNRIEENTKKIFFSFKPIQKTYEMGDTNYETWLAEMILDVNYLLTK